MSNHDRNHQEEPTIPTTYRITRMIRSWTRAQLAVVLLGLALAAGSSEMRRRELIASLDQSAPVTEDCSRYMQAADTAGVMQCTGDAIKSLTTWYSNYSYRRRESNRLGWGIVALVAAGLVLSWIHFGHTPGGAGAGNSADNTGGRS